MPSASLNVPHYKQEFPYSCVAACARMVLAYHGRAHTEAELRRVLDVRESGTRARNLEKLEQTGFKIRFESLNLSQLAAALAAGLPPNVFLDTGPLEYWSVHCAHVVVVVGADETAISINDPYFDDAPQRASVSNFLSAWALNGHLAAVIRPLLPQ